MFISKLIGEQAAVVGVPGARQGAPGAIARRSMRSSGT